MIVFSHTKFGLAQIKGSGVKKEGARIPPPSRPERVFEIPAWIGLKVPWVAISNKSNRCEGCHVIYSMTAMSKKSCQLFFTE